MSSIEFKAKPVTIGAWTLIRLPPNASAQLPSRGMTVVEGSLNGAPLRAALEPDGRGSHWFRLDPALLAAARAGADDTLTLAIQPTKECPEPEVPADLQAALADHPQEYARWLDLTPLARWDWIRWIRATKQADTRQRRIEAALSKLSQGERRPCCFNRNLCSEPDVSKNGVLLEPNER